MIFNKLETLLLGNKEKQTKLQFTTVRLSPFRLSNNRHLRNRGLVTKMF